MSDFRVIKAELSVEFEEARSDFELEFQNSHNGLDEWMSMLRAKEEGQNTDPLTLKILTEVLRKLDNIENKLNGNEGLSALANHKIATKLGYEGFGFDEDCLEVGKNYFARVRIHGFVHKEIKLFFTAIDAQTAKITRISKFDEKEWASNVARYEMGAIRAMKKKEKDEY